MGKLKSHQKLPANWNEREALRDKGQFWTPDWVADAMVSYAAQDTNQIFDPATGKGAFCEATLRLNQPTLCFYGTDIDTDVLKESIYDNKNCFVEQRDFIKNPPPQKFKAIVGNPPYIRHHRIDEQTKRFLKALTVNITGFTIDGRAGYHIYFLLQALHHLEKDGRLAFIMPADTCEGKFAKDLWAWISKNFCLEAVIAFDAAATPFPNVDTNVIVFLIKNTAPTEKFYWIKAAVACSSELRELVSSAFQSNDFKTLQMRERRLKEALNTGLSRREQTTEESAYCLDDFATVMRGIATGSNEFFFLTSQRVKELCIPREFLKRAVGRTRDIAGSILTDQDVERLDKENRPTFLLSINGQDEPSQTVLNYLQGGKESGLPNRSLIKQRRPWYKMEQRQVPPLLFAYLGRRHVRFIKNEAGVLPLTGFLCVYPLHSDDAFIDKLWKVLNHPDTLENLSLVGKSYGSGAIKVEPGALSRLPIPEHVILQFDLARPYKTTTEQLTFF